MVGSTQVKAEFTIQVSEEPVSTITLKVWPPSVIGARNDEPVDLRRLVPPLGLVARRRRCVDDVVIFKEPEIRVSATVFLEVSDARFREASV